MEIDTNSTTPQPGATESEMFAGLAHTLQTIALAALVFAAFTCAPKLMQLVQLARLPALSSSLAGKNHGQGYLRSAKELYSEGYQKFKNRVYLMTTSDGETTAVVPHTYLPELRKLPDDVLSFPKAIDRSMEVKYTKIDPESTLSVHAIRSDLTPALARLNPTICAEVDAAMREHLPPCDDWTEVCINDRLIDVITKVSGRVFVGPDLCHDPEYLECGSKYTIYLMDAVQAIKRVRPWLRPFVVPRLPELQRLRDMEKRAARKLQPIVRERMEAEKNDPNWQKPDDMMQWLLNHSAEHGVTTIEGLAKAQLGLIFAAIHTTTLTTTNILYTLAVTPEYIQPLREEVREAMAVNGGSITAKALQQMTKLDSYMKEVTRLYSPLITAFGRRVLKGITLSNGQYIPPGVILEVPAHAIHSDPELCPDGATFDGFRYHKLRQGGTATENARNQFVTTNESNLAFGYGRHACPGRFFAANEIKMIVARMILDFEIKMPGDKMERYEQVEIGRSSIPNPAKTLMLKRVEI